MFANVKDIRRKNTGGAASGLEADQTAQMCRLRREWGGWDVGVLVAEACVDHQPSESSRYVDFAVNCSVTCVSTSW